MSMPFHEDDYKKLRTYKITEFPKRRSIPKVQNEKSMEERTVIHPEIKANEVNHGVKWFKTTCHFEPKLRAVSYAEKFSVNVGTKKKEFQNSIIFQKHLTPVKWTESVTVYPKLPYQPVHRTEKTIQINNDEICLN